MAEPEPIQDTLASKAESLKENQLFCDNCKKDTHDTKDHGKMGGRRKGAGFPKGQKKKKTLEAMRIKEAFNQRIMKHADDLFNAQLDLAVGEKVLMVKVRERDSKGKILRTYFEQVENKETIKEYLDWEDGDGEDPSDDQRYYFMTTKSANNQAIDSLINRALGKVPDKLEVEGGFFNTEQIQIEVVGSNYDKLNIDGDGRVNSDDGGSTGEHQEGSESTDKASVVEPAGSSDSPAEPSPGN